MDIIVCVKQVPDVSELRVDPVTHNLIREGVPSILNPYDRIAAEEAVRIKENLGGQVTVVSMGPTQAKSALEECLAMGADNAVLISDRVFAAADTWATAYTVAEFIRRQRYDLILCGQKAIDAETGQTGPQIAEFLRIPHITYVRKLDVIENERKVVAEREQEDGYEVVETPLPALITVTNELNEPRLPTLQGVLRSKRTPIKIITSSELGGDPQHYGLRGSPTIVAKVFMPVPREGGVVLTGSPQEAVQKLVQQLIAKGILASG